MQITQSMKLTGLKFISHRHTFLLDVKGFFKKFTIKKTPHTNSHTHTFRSTCTQSVLHIQTNMNIYTHKQMKLKLHSNRISCAHTKNTCIQSNEETRTQAYRDKYITHLNTQTKSHMKRILKAGYMQLQNTPTTFHAHTTFCYIKSF